MKAFLKGFTYAFHGVLYGILSERNMRVHLSVLAYMVFFLTRYDFFQVSKTQLAVLMLAAGVVLAAEYINTAIERTVDTATKGERCETARIAKDTAAGAVLITAIFAVAVGVLILFQPEAFRALFAYFAASPLKILLFAVSFVLALLFIFVSPSRYLKNFRR
ncbi:MAG TPA: diacylglycerol kinase [Ruminococcaceae bacterium]|nr:diacylglycerol kinase [Oscillospiraceae bacterium]